MKRFTAFCGSLLALAVLSTVAAADVFYSGIVDVNGGLAGGNPTPIDGARNIGSGSNGVSYNNTWTGTTGGSGGIPINGAKLTAAGFIPITSALVGNNPAVPAPGFNLVAVYAFEGQAQVINAATGAATGDFNPDVAVPGSTIGGFGGGVVNFYDRRGAAPLSLTDPNTWVPNPADLTQGLIGQLRIDSQASAYLQGPPGGTTTQIPVVNGVDNVNTFPFILGQFTQNVQGDLKLEFTNLFNVLAAQAGSLFQDLKVQSPNPTEVRTSLDLLVKLFQESVDGRLGGQPIPDITKLNSLFDALLDTLIAGSHAFSNQAVLGDAFDNVTNNNIPNALTGDDSVLNSGGVGIPGGQFQVVGEPEPATIAVWCVVGLIGAAAGRKLKQLKKVA